MILSGFLGYVNDNYHEGSEDGLVNRVQHSLHSYASGLDYKSM